MWFNRHKNLTMAGGIGMAAVLLMILAVLPIYRNASEVMGKIKTRSSELESLSAKVLLLSKLDPAVLESRVRTLDRALPPRKDVLLYLNSIDGLSVELGLAFGGISILPGELTQASGSASKKQLKTEGLQSLETEIKVRGDQGEIYGFLRNIEEVLPLMQINDIKVAVLGDEQYSLTLKLGMLWAEPITVDVKSQITLFGAEEEKYFAQLSLYRQFEPAESNENGAVGKVDLFSVATPQQ